MKVAPATAIAGVSFNLTRNRFAARQGETLLYVASIIAYVVSSALALTIAGGTWMFYSRWQHPTGPLAELLAEDPRFETIGMVYFALAIIACALVVPSIISLAGNAAVLGARGRERRLAALRLIGLAPGDVNRMALIDTTIQAAIGIVLGLALFYVSLPAWQLLSIGGMHIQAGEMMLPWYLLLGVCLAVLVLGLNASWWALRRVRISPLGVARLATNPRLKWWRLLAFIVILGTVVAAMQFLNLGRDYVGYLIMAGIVLLTIVGLNIVGPWLLQVESRTFAKLPFPSVMWSARRIEANPKLTWQRVASLGLMSFIGGFIALMPIEFNPQGIGERGLTFAMETRWDFTKGAIIVLAAGFVLTATSILITQASAVLERRDQSVAMAKMGAPASFGRKTMWLETLGPLAVSVLLGAGLGMGLATPMAQMAAKLGFDNTWGPTIMGSVLTVGLLLAVAALAAVEPLQRQVLSEQRRAND